MYVRYGNGDLYSIPTCHIFHVPEIGPGSAELPDTLVGDAIALGAKHSEVQNIASYSKVEPFTRMIIICLNGLEQ